MAPLPQISNLLYPRIRHLDRHTQKRKRSCALLDLDASKDAKFYVVHQIYEMTLTDGDVPPRDGMITSPVGRENGITVREGEDRILRMGLYPVWYLPQKDPIIPLAFVDRRVQ
jgi:hypothetical protein